MRLPIVEINLSGAYDKDENNEAEIEDSRGWIDQWGLFDTNNKKRGYEDGEREREPIRVRSQIAHMHWHSVKKRFAYHVARCLIDILTQTARNTRNSCCYFNFELYVKNN